MTQHQLLVKKARSAGIKVEDISNLMGTEAALFEKNGRSELIREGIPTSWLNVSGQFYCDNKQLTKRAFKNAGIPYPKSIAFSHLEQAASFFQQGQTYVCKPIDATHGEGVVMHLTSLAQITDYLEKHKHISKLFLLEEQIAGEDLRFHVIGGKIVAACIRKPAFVEGNGKDSLQTLIEKRREIMRGQNINNKLEINKTTLELLQKQAISLKDIPEKEKKIKLKYVSNMAQGGICIDVTPDVHPNYQQWVDRLATLLRTSYFGLDFLSTDYTCDPLKNTTTFALEVNARGDWLHHTFSERKTHDIPTIILKNLLNLKS